MKLKITLTDGFKEVKELEKKHKKIMRIKGIKEID